MQNYSFISGLPRSGSTLLSAILNQNPDFYSSITDSLQLCTDAIAIGDQHLEGVRTALTEEERVIMIRAMFNALYQSRTNASNCINTNRGWMANTSLLKKIFPEFKMIVCFRGVIPILNSFERLEREDPFKLKGIYNRKRFDNVFDRSSFLMKEGGLVSSCFHNMKQAAYSEERHHMLFVSYDRLIDNPTHTLNKIYEFLEVEPYEHDFSSVDADYSVYDTDLSTPNLHKVESVVRDQHRINLLPDDIMKTYGFYDFWNSPDFPFKDAKWVI